MHRRIAATMLTVVLALGGLSTTTASAVSAAPRTAITLTAVQGTAPGEAVVTLGGPAVRTEAVRELAKSKSAKSKSKKKKGKGVSFFAILLILLLAGLLVAVVVWALLRRRGNRH
ncbi:hypothetical protein ACIA8O_27415 [Kitasatospora sp. NPDC051853]|uniref:hypothetical protein n=1 Tax=Kitasatospora sp. NPDC051853 TaxID=3364058 RepID=UPI00379B931E